MNRSALILALVAQVLVSAAEASAQTKVNLRPKWEKGAMHRFRMDLASTNSLSLTGDGAPAGEGVEQHVLNQDVRFTLKVVDAPPEADATVELTYESFKVSMDSPMGKGEFDSTKGGGKGGAKPKDGGEVLDGGSITDLYKPLVGTKLTLVIDPEGNIKSVRGGETLTRAEMTAPLTQQGEMARLFGPIFSPTKGGGLVSVGESWENVDLIDSGLIGRFKMTTKHTVRSATQHEAVVAIDGRIETDSEAAPGAYAVRDGTYAGTYAWGLPEGMLRRMETSKSFRIEAGGDDPVSIASRVTMKVTREE